MALFNHKTKTLARKTYLANFHLSLLDPMSQAHFQDQRKLEN